MSSRLIRGLAAAAVIVAGGAIAAPVRAAFTNYTDRTSFETAAAGVGSLSTQDFEGNTQDASFKIADGSVVAGHLTFTELGPVTSFDDTNRVDVAPYVFSSLNPTSSNFALIAVSYNSASTPDTSVQITFDSPVSAFGITYRGTASADTSELAQFTLIGAPSATTIQLPDDSSGLGRFFGFVADGGETFTGITITAQRYLENRRSAYGFDNITIASVPEPASAGIAVIIGGFMLARRRQARS